MPIGILGGLAICTLIYVIVGIVATGLVPYQQLKAADPLARALEVAGLTTASWIVAFGAVVSLTAVLLVFQYGQPRIFFAMARDGLLPAWASQDPPEVPDAAHHDRRDRRRRRARQPGRRRERDLRPHQHRHAVRVRDRLRRRAGAALQGSRSRPRPFRVPFVWGVSLIGAAACIYVMVGLPTQAWERFGYWLALGLLLYFVYGYRHSRLRAGERTSCAA